MTSKHTSGVKPLDLSNLLKHAFYSGAGYTDKYKVSEADVQRWLAYNPEGLKPYERICAALAPSDAKPVSEKDIIAWRDEWIAENDPRDGTDCVTPFDKYLYGTLTDSDFKGCSVGYNARILSALAPSDAEPDEDEAAIDALRHKAFMSNSEADRQAYFDAVSKWFQHRHHRRMAHPDSSSDAEPVAWVDELGNFWLTEAVAKQYDAKPLYTHPDSSSEAVRITDEMVEKAARALSRFGKSFPTIDDEIEWVDTKWPRYKDEARTALIAALKGEVKK